jgi:ABC-2 type transport system permease protein
VIAALIGSRLHERRRSLLAWGLPLGVMCGFEVMIYPSVEDSLQKAMRNYPEGLKEAFGIGQLSTVEQYLHAEMLSLILPLALGYLAARALAAGLAGAAESGRLEVLLSSPVSRRQLVGSSFLAAAVELAAVLVAIGVLTGLGSVLVGAGLEVGPAAAGFAAVWPLALFFAGLAVVACGFSLRTAVVTGSVAGVLVAMYVLDLVGRLDTGLSGLRYLSVFKYYGNAIEEGIEPLAFCGVTLAAVLLAALGAWLFDRRDLAG